MTNEEKVFNELESDKTISLNNLMKNTGLSKPTVIKYKKVYFRKNKNLKEIKVETNSIETKEEIKRNNKEEKLENITKDKLEYSDDKLKNVKDVRLKNNHESYIQRNISYFFMYMSLFLIYLEVNKEITIDNICFLGFGAIIVVLFNMLFDIREENKE